LISFRQYFFSAALDRRHHPPSDSSLL
jgi:hypothetical protein